MKKKEIEGALAKIEEKARELVAANAVLVVENERLKKELGIAKIDNQTFGRSVRSLTAELNTARETAAQLQSQLSQITPLKNKDIRLVRDLSLRAIELEQALLDRESKYTTLDQAFGRFLTDLTTRLYGQPQPAMAQDQLLKDIVPMQNLDQECQVVCLAGKRNAQVDDLSTIVIRQTEVINSLTERLKREWPTMADDVIAFRWHCADLKQALGPHLNMSILLSVIDLVAAHDKAQAALVEARAANAEIMADLRSLPNWLWNAMEQHFSNSMNYRFSDLDGLWCIHPSFDSWPAGRSRFFGYMMPPRGWRQKLVGWWKTRWCRRFHRRHWTARAPYIHRDSNVLLNRHTCEKCHCEQYLMEPIRSGCLICHERVVPGENYCLACGDRLPLRLEKLIHLTADGVLKWSHLSPFKITGMLNGDPRKLTAETQERIRLVLLLQ